MRSPHAPLYLTLCQGPLPPPACSCIAFVPSATFQCPAPVITCSVPFSTTADKLIPDAR